MIEITYGAKKAIRSRLGIRADDTSQDENIELAISYADGWIDSAHAAIGQAVTSPTPQALIDVANDLATAWMYRITEPTKSTVYQESGERLLVVYMQKYSKGTASRTGIDD